MLNQVAQQFDTVAIEYDFMATVFHNVDFFLENLSDNRTSALDIGCGSGNLVNALSKQYEHVIGIDISESLLAIALAKKSSSNIDYVCMDAENLALDLKFDFIVSQNMFHHIENIPKLLKRLRDLLKPSGKIIITDVTSHNPTPPTWVYILGAFQELIPNILKYGVSVAWRVFRFRISPHWLHHLANDVYMSPQQFRQTYAIHLSGCQFINDGTLIWQKTN